MDWGGDVAIVAFLLRQQAEVAADYPHRVVYSDHADIDPGKKPAPHVAGHTSEMEKDVCAVVRGTSSTRRS